MGNALIIPHFSGGVVRNVPPDNRGVNELRDAVGVDLGPRGDLRPAATTTPWFLLTDESVGALPWEAVFGLTASQWAQGPVCIAIGAGYITTIGDQRAFTAALFTPVTGTSAPTVTAFTLPLIGYSRPVQGALVTFASFPYVDSSGTQVRPTFFNLGPRSGLFPREAPGLSVLTFDGSSTYARNQIVQFDALGTGAQGEYTGGTHAVQLYFRCIAAYNNHLFGAGFDNSDSTNGDGPSRLMFSNVGNPFKWGNDNQAAVGTDRAFSDTDAITVGEAGEVIQCLYASAGALWIGTNKGLHYLRGYGRNSFTTDGTTRIADALDTIGPSAMIEGPDGLLYGVSTRGLWRYAGGQVEHLYRGLVDPDGQSVGWWDCIWSDASATDDFPGRTNADLVWMYVDPDTQAVCVVIPFCDATVGVGKGTDTLMIKFHVETSGFTRWVSTAGDAFSAGAVVKRDSQVPAAILLGNAQSTSTIERYAFRLYPFSVPAATDTSVAFGPYAPFGPTGVGVLRTAYVTVSWRDLAAGDVGLVLTPTIDGTSLSPLAVTISATAPSSPVDGAYWVDAAGTDTVLGSPVGRLLLKRWSSAWNSWELITRLNGAALVDVTVPATPSTTTTVQSGRATVPLSFAPVRGTRIGFTATWSGGERAVLEAIGMGPVPLRSAA